jgi:hypothetical protein
MEVTITTLEWWISTRPARIRHELSMATWYELWTFLDVELSAAAVNVRGLGKDRQSPEKIGYYNISAIQHYDQTDSTKYKDDLCWANQSSIFDPSIKAQLRLNIYLAFSFSELAVIRMHKILYLH